MVSDALSRTEAAALVLSGGGRAAARSQLREHHIMERAEIRLRLDMGSRSVFSFNASAFMSWDAQTPHACLQGSTRLTACNDIIMHSLCLCHGIHRRRCCLQGSPRLTAYNDIFCKGVNRSLSLFLCLCHGIHRRRMLSSREAHDLLPSTTYVARV